MKLIKRIVLLLPLVVLLAMGGLFLRSLSLDDAVPSALISQPFPGFSLPVLSETGSDEQMVTEEILKGQISLVNVWATWCPTCYVEHPFFVELAQQGMTIFGMNYKDQRADAIGWLAKLGDPYHTTFEDASGRLGIDLGVRGAPETFLVDSHGVIRYKHEGELNARVWQTLFVPRIAEIEQEGQ